MSKEPKERWQSQGTRSCGLDRRRVTLLAGIGRVAVATACLGATLCLMGADGRETGRDRALYSVDQPVSFEHMRLQLTFTAAGLKARTCEGRVEFTLRPRAKEARTVRLDAVDIRILKVELPGQGTALSFSYDDKLLTVQLPKAAPPREAFRLAVTYRLEEPRKGMYFVLPSESAPRKPLMVYTMSEPLEARYWVPCHDWPNARWTSDIEVTAPSPYTAVANGTLVEKRTADDGKSNTFHWRSEQLTDPHLMGMVLGELVEQRELWRGKPVVTFTQPGSEAAARFTFQHVPEMLEYFSGLIGYDFPYPGYTHITVVDHHHGGMEHAGFSFVSPFYLTASDDGDWPLEHTENWLIAHMVAHQWFGGVVNYRSVSQAWLNESFGTYLDTLWASHREMPARLEYEMWQKSRGVAGADSSESGKPMVNRDLPDAEAIYQMDGLKIYYKGAWVLHMLRHDLGDEIFWRGVRQYLHDREWQSVETSDLRQALEKVSGLDLEQFFQQWVYGHGVPRLEVDYAWDGAQRMATVTVKQTQKIDAITPAFTCPLKLSFRVQGKETNVTAELRDSRHEFRYEFETEPTLFCVDPHEALLKTLAVNVPRAMLVEQTRKGPTALSRLQAVEAIGKEPRAEDSTTFEQVLWNESEWWGVRQSAARCLGRMQTDKALSALLNAERAGLADQRVLATVIETMANFVVSREAHEAVLRHANREQPLSLEAAAIRTLGQMRGSPEQVERSREAVLAAAKKPGRRTVRLAAFASLRALGDTNADSVVLELAQPARDDELRGEAIGLLGRLGRGDAERDRTRTALTTWLDDPDPAAQLAAIGALGELGDPRVLADLERIRSSTRTAGVRRAAGHAIEAIKRPVEPRQSTAGLIDRLDTLEKQNQKLEKKLKALTDRLDANIKGGKAETPRGALKATN
ncbi:MAG TPA: M1 family aminopeptidase [Verrucomicrobiae bacterium]